MTPLLSIIVPVHNHARSLSKLLVSITRQSFKELQLVIVDDASTEELKDDILYYKENGLDIRLHRSPTRLYTKNARLRGIELCKGEIIAFADADDEFAEADILERHINLYINSGCDTLHFCTTRLHSEEGEESYNIWADPFAKELKGTDIFRVYSQTLAGHVMWNKLYSRRLWMRHIESAKAVPITICSEDLFLSTFYLFHARHYVGSEFVGYMHKYTDKTGIKAACRGHAYFILLQDFLPYLEANSCPADILHTISARLERDCRAYVNRACLEVANSFPQSTNMYNIADSFAEIPEDRVIDLLIYTNGKNADMLSSWARDFL